MCNPAVAMLAISAVQAGVQYKQQKDYAEDQTQNTITAHNYSRAQLEDRQKQDNTAARQQMSERAKAALVERSRLRAASAETGMTGTYLDKIFGAGDVALGSDLATMQANQSSAARQSMWEGIGMTANTQSRLNSIQRPSLLNTGLQIAGAGVDAYGNYKKTSTKSNPLADRTDGPAPVEYR